MRNVFLIAVLVALTGCCTCRDRYKPALDQWAENLDALRPTMEKGAATLPDDLGQSKLDRYDRTTQGIKRVAGEGVEVWSGEAAPSE